MKETKIKETILSNEAMELNDAELESAAGGSMPDDIARMLEAIHKADESDITMPQPPQPPQSNLPSQEELLQGSVDRFLSGERKPYTVIDPTDEKMKYFENHPDIPW